MLHSKYIIFSFVVSISISCSSPFSENQENIENLGGPSDELITSLSVEFNIEKENLQTEVIQLLETRELSISSISSTEDLLLRDKNLACIADAQQDGVLNLGDVAEFSRQIGRSCYDIAVENVNDDDPSNDNDPCMNLVRDASTTSQRVDIQDLAQFAILIATPPLGFSYEFCNDPNSIDADGLSDSVSPYQESIAWVDLDPNSIDTHGTGETDWVAFRNSLPPTRDDGESSCAKNLVRRGLINYGSTTQPDRLDIMATEFSHAIGTANANALISRNPSFELFEYKSATDNYVSETTSPWHTNLMAFAETQIAEPEDLYLHFHEDSALIMEGVLVNIPGCYGARPCPEASRIPIYYKNLSRRLVAFHRADLRSLQVQFYVNEILRKPIARTNPPVYPRGIFLDNTSAVLHNYGTIQSGGNVEETIGQGGTGPDGRLRMNDTRFAGGYRTFGWYQEGLFQFTRDLTAYMDANPMDHNGQMVHTRLSLNIANSWNETFRDVTKSPVAHHLYIEFQGNPIRDFGQNTTLEFYQRNLDLETLGIEQLFHGLVQTSISSYEGSYTYDETYLSIVAMYWAMRSSPTSVVIGTGASTMPDISNWEELVLRGVTSVDLGRALAAPYVFQTGRDPLGQNYTIIAREFENGFAFVRNRGDYNQHISTETAVNISLPQSLYPVNVHGEILTLTSTDNLRNGQGKIYLKTRDQTCREPN